MVKSSCAQAVSEAERLLSVQRFIQQYHFHDLMMTIALANAKPDPFALPLPGEMTEYPRGLYNPLPTFRPGAGDIGEGYAVLAEAIHAELPHGLRVLVIDGYHGADWGAIREKLAAALEDIGVSPTWMRMEECLAPPEEIRERSKPFLGGSDPLFGKVYPYGLEIFFDSRKLSALRVRASIARGRKSGSLLIIIGCGAGLVELWDRLWYVDIPKDLIQESLRREGLSNLGEPEKLSFGDFYKRAYFLEWPALNRQKKKLLPDLDLFLDGQNPARPTSMAGPAFREALREISESPFRVRPWFFPGPWGGQFMKGHMGLDRALPNCAWSFELIVPENGITLDKGGRRLEFSFDILMYAEHLRVLGEEAGRQFKYEWPIRLDYLDTIDGGNLSTQCHPRPDYIRTEFGETFTQDETYYIVNAKPDARVFLGLTDDCEPEVFRNALEESREKGVEIDIDRFVHSEPSKPHDLFLIPNGTVHCSGRGNLVLEVSSTPYIFTFKIYDYLRKDLDGNLRTINLERAFDNIRFERRSAWVRENLLAKPRFLREGKNWREFVLMDRPEFFYTIHRLEFEKECEFHTKGCGFAANLVEGERISLTSANGYTSELAYLESMIIPAAARKVRMINRGSRPCKLLLVFVRPGTGVSQPLNDPIT